MRALTRPLLALLALNLLPQFGLRPLWVTAVAAAMLGFRIWLEWTGRPQPKRAWVWGSQVILVALIWNEFHSFFGEEAAGAFLLLLTMLKSFELRVKRDYFITAMLCVLVLMSDLLLDQGLSVSLFLLVDVFAVLVFLRALEDERWIWDFKTFLRPSLALCLKASPLLILTFLLFPRFSTGFGSGGDSGARTGVTDSLRPGAVSQLIPSDELIFRATFLNGEVPPRRQLYWRGAVLEKSHGLNWDREDKYTRPILGANEIDNPDVEIYLEPGNDRFLFALESTGEVAFPNTSNRVLAREGHTYQLAAPIQTRDRYYLKNGRHLKENQNFAEYLQLDEKPSPQMQKFLHRFSGQSAEKIVAGLMTHFREGGFHYSLEAPPAKTIDDFLFKTKIGFCEHFAGTLATVLRELKVPSRVVVGFQGGSPSFLDNYISVRGHDAHAWVEYYDSERGDWRRADPTAEVAPLRLSQGSDSYFAQGQQLMPSWIPGDWSQSYFKARAFLDEVDASWVSFLLNFDLAKQKELLAKIGLENVLFRALPVFLLLAFALVMAVIYFVEAQRREKLPIEEKLYLKLLKALKRYKIQRETSDGPFALMNKIRSVDARLAESVEPILARLTEARFGTRPLTRTSASQIRRALRKI